MTNETIADIIAEMKREAAQIFPALPIAVLQLATRLEAAWKRERELTKPAENVNSGAASDTAGNCAKLREALVETLGYIESFHKYIIPGKRKKLTALFAVADTIRGKVRAALAAPPRNCDRFATLPDALAAWRDVDPREAGPFDLWLFAPATEQEGGANG